MKKFFALLLSIMLLSTAALAEVKIGQVEYAAHGTSCFAVLTVAMDGDTIVAAHIDEFQFMDAATAEGVPNSDASFGQNYPEGKVLASKVVNDGLYSTNMTTKAGATTPLGVSYNAIEAFVTGKTIAELEAAIEGKTKEEMVDAVSSSTLVDTLGYVQGSAGRCQGCEHPDRLLHRLQQDRRNREGSQHYHQRDRRKVCHGDGRSC